MAPSWIQERSNVLSDGVISIQGTYHKEPNQIGFDPLKYVFADTLPVVLQDYIQYLQQEPKYRVYYISTIKTQIGGKTTTAASTATSTAVVTFTDVKGRLALDIEKHLLEERPHN